MEECFMSNSVASVPRGRWAAEVPSGEGIRTENAFESSRPTFVKPVSQTGNNPVEIEALALIKMMRHCREYFPTPVNGLLLGLDKEQVLEVTDCFGLQNKKDLLNQLMRDKIDAKDVDEKVLLEEFRYQVKMLEQLNLVNADCCNVGWYQSMQFEDMKDITVVEGLSEHQELVSDALGIGFDPLLAPLGLQAFKAFRVTEEVLKARRLGDSADGTPNFSAFNGLRGKDILVEVPLVIRNSLLVQAFLHDWLSCDERLQQTGEFEALEDGDTASYVHKSLDFVSSCLDDLFAEQDKLMKFQKDKVRQLQKQRELAERRRLENEQRRLHNEDPLPEISVSIKRSDAPSQLPTLLMSNHVNRIGERLSSLIADNIARSVLLQRQLRQ